MSTQADVIRAVAVMAELHQRQMSPEAAAMYCADLAPYAPGAVLEALSRCRREVRGFPAIVDVLERITGTRPPDEMDAARAVSSRIIEAISKIGYVNPGKARDFLGDLAWTVVQRMGGWANLCEIVTAENLTTWQAQLRDNALSVSRQAAAGTLNVPQGLPEHPSLRALEMARNSTKTIDFKKTP